MSHMGHFSLVNTTNHSFEARDFTVGCPYPRKILGRGRVRRRCKEDVMMLWIRTLRALYLVEIVGAGSIHFN